VLARLDPPEAYLPEGTGSAPGSDRMSIPARAPIVKRRADAWAGRASARWGLSTFAVFLLFPFSYLVLAAENSLVLAYILPGSMVVVMFISSVVSLTLGIYARRSGAWAVVGIATSVLGLLFSVGIATILVLRA
jgi:hypothetical protein